MRKIIFLDIIIFLSAFLLFQIELIIAKILLPSFGGSYLVWGACVVFFQTTLLAGYIYSHLVAKKFGIVRYRYFHLILLFSTLLFFPAKPIPLIYPHYQMPLVFDVFWQLLRSIGLVFFVLSTTSIIFQSWLAASELPEQSNPYILYAVSNMGSFAALLSYPFFFEVFFDLGTQLFFWRVGYLLLLAFHILVFKFINVMDKGQEEGVGSGEIRVKEQLRWLLLGAAGVIMFLSVTNIITYEVAPIPLLWIIPLCIYLLSFVLVFKKHPWCPIWISEKFHITVGLSTILFFLMQKRIFPFMFEVFCLYMFLFIVCMFCQNELYKHKPDRRNLTIFYVISSTGGVMGGILVSWIMPLVSTIMVEYLFGLFIISLALLIDDQNRTIGRYGMRLVLYIAFLIMLWPLAFKNYNIFGLIVIILIFKFIFSELKTRPRAFYLSLLVILCLAYFSEPFWTRRFYIYRHRNYYGIYKIYDQKGRRFLMHGTTLHGAQYLDEKKQKEPLTYYHRLTPVGELMTSDIFNFRHIGVIGLGAGTLSAYINPNQDIDFFEIDPDVYRMATEYFTYLKNSAGKINFIFGDARLSFNKIPHKSYDLLIVDAFSGDSIPIHLLSIEAILKYKAFLSQQGIILFHVSNRYLNLTPILFSNAHKLNSFVCKKYNEELPDGEACASSWVAFSWNADVFQKIISGLKWDKPESKLEAKYIRPWTDQYSNISRSLRLKGLFDGIKEFQPFYW